MLAALGLVWGFGVLTSWKASIGRGLFLGLVGFFFSFGRVLTGIFACPAASGCQGCSGKFSEGLEGGAGLPAW